MKSFWNERYREQEAAYGTHPNAFFAAQLALLTPGSLLLPCDGEGRNSVHAAQHGWDVHSFDYSEAGVDKALRWAEGAGVQVNARVADALEYEPDQLFDAVALVFAHLPADKRLAFHRRAAHWLRPGGTLIVEGFHPDQLGLSSGGPKDVAMLFTESLLLSDFEGLDVVHSSTTRTSLNEGPFHQGEAAVVRWVARRPQS